MTPAAFSFLVVEDHAFHRGCLVQMLTNLGAASVHAARDGEEALKVMERMDQPPEIVICDINMPGMDAMEFARRWSERGDTSSLILMSAVATDALGTMAAMGMACKVRLLGVVSKPATAGTITQLVDLHRSQHLGAPDDGTAFSFQELTNAWGGDEFECWFEPRINLATGSTAAMAAVPRWRHRTRGLLELDAFLPALRVRGLEDEFAWLHLQQAASACRRWQRRGETISVSVNLGFKSLADIGLAPRIHHVLQGEGLDPRLMILHIDEAALEAAQLAHVLENFARLRLLGFGLAVDYLGIGPMALDRLSMAAFTELHVPGTCVVGPDSDPSTRAGLAVALLAAQHLRVPAVATGIASRHEWTELCEGGCRFGQGPFIAAPVSRSEASQWLGSRKPVGQSK